MKRKIPINIHFEPLEVSAPLDHRYRVEVYYGHSTERRQKLEDLGVICFSAETVDQAENICKLFADEYLRNLTEATVMKLMLGEI